MIEAQDLIKTLKQELTHASLTNLNQLQIKYLGRNGSVSYTHLTLPTIYSV